VAGHGLTLPNLPLVTRLSVRLERSGEIADPHDASWFLVKTVAELATKGERRRLVLINRAIDAYRRHRQVVAA
jgi:hypothetical protein